MFCTLAHHVEPLGAGYVALTVEMPQENVESMLLFISSMADLCRSLNTKTRNSGVQARIAQTTPAREQHALQFANDTIAAFDGFIERNTPPREALSLTVSLIHQQYPSSSYDIVKQILTKSKRLKKTGFYKKER